MHEFRFKPFAEMTADDYRTVGFKSGLEVHQQLLTEQKLFCRCPAGRYSEEYHAELLRHMRPTLSELGEYDGTALMEYKTRKEIIYRINKETVCTYEMDDTPPFMINETALDIGIEISLLAGLSLVDEVHIARKQYLDGSIPTGFQRTTILGVNGSIPYGEREIEIIQLGLEEDSCREISDVGHTRTYRTDRLGMPLIEIVTGPDMRTPQEVAEVGQLVRKMMRITGHVRRGIGSTRADTNVSVTGGTRIEIKGVPKIGLMPLLTYNEARRQWNLLRLREELKKRGITEETFSSDSADVTRHLKKTLYTPIRDAVAKGQQVHVVRLAGWKDLLLWETQEGTVFSREISDRVRVIACLTTLPNIIHSDSPSETIFGAEWKEVRKAVSCTPDDTIVIVWGDEKDMETAVKEIAIRAREVTMGVPSETRQALRDGNTGFERILPGPQRMYPDTDLPPATITDERIEAIRARLPVQYWTRVRQFKSHGIPADAIEGLALSPLAGLVDEALDNFGLSVELVATALHRHPRRLRREGFSWTDFNPDEMRQILKAVAEERMTAGGIMPAIRDSLAGKFNPEEIPARLKPDAIHPFIVSAVESLEMTPLFDERNRQVLVLDLVMDEVRGRISGDSVAGIVEQYFAQEKNR